RSLAELDELARRLPDVSGEYRGFARAWRGGLHDASSANLERYVEAHPEWKTRLGDQTLREESEAERRNTSTQLLSGLGPFPRAHPNVSSRLELLAQNATLADAIAYRMEIRLGVALRLRALLIDIAGRTWLAGHGTERDRETLAGLVRCEDFALPEEHLPPEGASVAETPPPPPYDQDVATAQRAQPAWMGIQFKESSAEQQKGLGVGQGAAMVVAVYPDSPAAAAGIEAGDVILGPPATPFTEKNQVRT